MKLKLLICLPTLLLITSCQNTTIGSLNELSENPSETKFTSEENSEDEELYTYSKNYPTEAVNTFLSEHKMNYSISNLYGEGFYYMVDVDLYDGEYFDLFSYGNYLANWSNTISETGLIYDYEFSDASCHIYYEEDTYKEIDIIYDEILGATFMTIWGDSIDE